MTESISQVDVDEPREDDDFLKFWRQHRRQGKTTTILGVELPIPTGLPLAFEDRYNELQNTDSDDQEKVAELLRLLFGEDVYARWKRNGLDTEMLKVLLVWGAANGGGTPMTFEEAVVKAAEWEAAAGKATAVPNRADRRDSSKTRASAKGGRSSARTSAASTASRKKPSPTSK